MNRNRVQPAFALPSFMGLIVLHLGAFHSFLRYPLESFKAGDRIPILFYVPALHRIFGDDLFPPVYIIVSAILFACAAFLNYKCIKIITRDKKDQTRGWKVFSESATSENCFLIVRFDR